MTIKKELLYLKHGGKHIIRADNWGRDKSSFKIWYVSELSDLNKVFDEINKYFKYD